MVRGLLLATAVVLAPLAQALDGAMEPQGRLQSRPAVLVDDFLEALQAYGSGENSVVAKPSVQLWVDGLKARGVKAKFVDQRLTKARLQAMDSGFDVFQAYKTVEVELFDDQAPSRQAAFPTALHAFRLDVIEDYDDLSNDDIYGYFITTHDDLIWGRVSSIYSGLDQGDSVFFNAEDRSLFGPKGEKLVAKNHTLIDFGLVESDSGDIKELQKISDVIVDLALVALSAAEPAAGAAAAQARAEIKNLLNLLIAMDNDDRLVTDTLRFTPDSMEGLLNQATVAEFDRLYEGKRGWSKYAWRVHFRLLK